jgi:hypothetical protein
LCKKGDATYLFYPLKNPHCFFQRIGFYGGSVKKVSALNYDLNDWINDITDRKLAEQTLREREAALEIRIHELEEVNTALKVLVKRSE